MSVLRLYWIETNRYSVSFRTAGPPIYPSCIIRRAYSFLPRRNTNIHFNHKFPSNFEDEWQISHWNEYCLQSIDSIHGLFSILIQFIDGRNPSTVSFSGVFGTLLGVPELMRFTYTIQKQMHIVIKFNNTVHQ